MEENEKRAQDLASRENKDVQNAVYDKSQGQLIDFEDIMMDDFPVVKKLKNLSDFGVTEEQIKALFEMSSDFSTGASLETALEELEKVFLVIANRLTNAPNGLVIDIRTGREDEVLSRIQCRELNIEYGDFREMPVSRREDAITELISTITVADFSKSVKENNEMYDNYLYSKMAEEVYESSEFYNETAPTEEDWQEFYKKMNFSKEEETDFENKRKNTLVENDAEKETILLIFEYEELLVNKATREELSQKLVEIKQYVLAHPESKFYNELVSIDNDGKAKLNNIIKFKDKWAKDRDEAKITEKFQEFEKILGENTFDQVQLFEIKSDLVRLLGEAFSFDNNENEHVNRMGEIFCQNHGIEYSFDAIKKMLLDIRGIEIDSIEDMREHCSQTTTVDNYRERIGGMQNISENERIDDLKTNSKNYISQSKLIVYKLLEEKLQNKSNEEKAIIMMSLYQKSRNKDINDPNSNLLTLSIISDYIRENRDFFESYTNVDSIVRKNGKDLRIRDINNLLRDNSIARNESEFTDMLLEDIDRTMDQFKKFKEIESENLDKLAQMAASLKTSTDKDTERLLAEKLETIHPMAINENMIKTLQGLNSARINEVLDKKFSTKDKIEEENIFGFDYYTVSQKVAFLTLNKNLQRNDESGKDTRGLEVITLYQKFAEAGDKFAEDSVRRYIELQPEYFRKYFESYKEGTIFDENGNLSQDKINSILEYIKLDKISQANVERMGSLISRSTASISKTRMDRKEDYKKLAELISEKKISEIDELLDEALRSALTLDEIKALRKLKSPEISKKLDILMPKDEKYKANIFYSDKNELSPDIQRVLLMEARIENSKGTPLFDKVIEERRGLYKTNSKYSEMALEIRNSVGELTANGKEKIKGYTNNLIDQTIEKNINEANIEKMTPDEKKRYTAILLMGVIGESYSVKKSSLRGLQEMYGETVDFSGNDTVEEIAAKIYFKNFGERVTKDEFVRKATQMRKNLGKRIIKQEYLKTQSMSEKLESIGQLSNEDFDVIFNDRYEELVDSAIDFKDPLESYFKDSRVEFSEDDVKSYNDLYAKTTVDSWISNRAGIDELKYGSLLLLREKVLENPELQEISEKLEFIDTEIARCKEKPELKNISEAKVKKDAEEYEELKTISKLLKDFSLQANQRVPYENLPREKKIDYLQGILIAQNRIDHISNDTTKKMLTQIVNRKLELMNNDDTKFITFDGKGNATINETALYQEYIQFNQVKGDNYTEIKEKFGKVYGYTYVLGKLGEYENNKEEEFVEINREGSLQEQLAEIEKMRFIKNQGTSLTQDSVDELIAKLQANMPENTEKNLEQFFDRNGSEQVGNQDIDLKSIRSEENGKSELRPENIETNAINYGKSQVSNLENGKTSFLDRIKDTINKFMQPKTSVGNDGNSEKGAFSKILNGIKNIFSRNEGQGKLPEPKTAKDMLTNNMNQYIISQTPTIAADMLNSNSSRNSKVSNKEAKDVQEEIEV